MYGLASCSGVMVKYIPNVGKVNMAVEPAVRAIIKIPGCKVYTYELHGLESCKKNSISTHT